MQHVTCIVCRYVMVKYADRGLAERGSVSPLFGTLYLVVCVSLLSVFSIFAFYYIINQNPNKKSNFHLMCMGKPIDFANFESEKSLTLVFALTLPLLLTLIFMFCSIQYYLHSRGFSKKVPVIIGKFRRNILSLKETFVITIIFFCFFYLHSIVIKFHNQFGLSAEMLQQYLFIMSLVINILIEGIMCPAYVLWNLHEQMPDFFSNQKRSERKFKIICNTNMEPRRLCRLCENQNNKKLPKPKYSNRMYKSKSSIIEMPEIVV